MSDERTVIFQDFRIDDWTVWDDAIYAQIGVFTSRHGLTPNILLANEASYSRLNLASANTAMRENILGPNGETPEPDEFPELDGFETEDCSLRFCLDTMLSDHCFQLIHDGAPTFTDGPDGDDGEPMPVEEVEEDLEMPEVQKAAFAGRMRKTA